MKAARVRLAVAAVLFLAWVGWLAHLVMHTRDQVILSRPQLLVADEWLIVEVEADGNGRPAETVTVREDVWSSKGKKAAGEKIEVTDLPGIGADSGWSGPGTYILPLTIHAVGKKDVLNITSLPPSPGFNDRGEKRIYLATPEARAQLDRLVKEWKTAPR
jgi:hypothetical protein